MQGWSIGHKKSKKWHLKEREPAKKPEKENFE